MVERAARGLRGLAATALLLASLLTLWQAVAAAPAGATEITQPAVACVDPKATYVLTSALPSHRSARWRAGVGRRGRCFGIQPGEQWERIYGVGGLTLMRRTPPQPGVPPLFFRDSVLSGAPPAPGSEPAPPHGGAFLPTPRSSASRAPVLRGPAHPTRIRPRHQDAAGMPVFVETLPPPERPAVPAAPASAPSPVPAVAAPAPDLRLADAGAEAPAMRPHEAPRLTPPPASAEVAAASARGYAIGFALAIALIVMSLAAVALLARVLLRPQRPTPAPPQEAPWLGVPIPRRPRIALRAVASPSPPLAMLQPVGSRAAWPGEDETDPRLQCAVLLREAGWDVSSRAPGRGPDLIARRRGRVVALRCLPASGLVDEQAVETACVARERVRADLAVIVSNARCTSDARQLASRIGVDLLRQDQLGAFAA